MKSKKQRQRRRRQMQKELPQEIKQHILSFLDFSDVIRASSVSKAWRDAASTLKCLTLKLAADGPWGDKVSLPSIQSSADHFLSELQNQDLYIQQLSLKFRHQTFDFLMAQADLVIRGSEDFEEFVFNVYLYDTLRQESLTVRFFHASQSLHKLVLEGVRISLEVGSKIDLPLLRELYLRRSFTQTEILEQLIMNSPQLETLEIHDCLLIRSLRVSGSHKLKRIILDLEDGGVEQIEIREAPNLEHFCHRHNGLMRLQNLNLASCRDLKVLELIMVRGLEENELGEEMFESIRQLVSYLNLLEVFKLTSYFHPARGFDISSNSIRELWLEFKYLGLTRLEHVQVMAPRLSKFHYYGFRPSQLRLVSPSSIKEAHFVNFRKDVIRRGELVKLLRSFNQCKALRLDDFRSDDFWLSGAVRKHNGPPPLAALKHLTIGTRYSLKNRSPPMHVYALESLLWMAPRLDTLSFVVDCESTITFQFIHETFSRNVDEVIPFVSRKNNKLIEVKVESCPVNTWNCLELRKYFFDDFAKCFLGGMVGEVKVMVNWRSAHCYRTLGYII